MNLLISDKNGKIFDLPFLKPAGMKANRFFKLGREDFVELPYGSELFMVPDRIPIGYDDENNEFISLHENPFKNKKEPCYPVSAFVSPGYTATYNSAFVEKNKNTRHLPLFAYSAVCFDNGKFYAACVRVDRELRQDLRYMDFKLIGENVKRFRKLFPDNRLMRHLESCALVYGCPAGRNFFLQRYEAPLPTSPTCNSNCLGCISYQPQKKCPATQPRIKFVPTPEEIAETALWHIKNVNDPVVSFGQGCEGEPLMAAQAIEKAVKIIRSRTKKGIINLNTNASRPEMVASIFDAGLDSIRVSMNSVRGKYYTEYYRPRGYNFNDVLESIKTANRMKKFVSINYLTMPGFTDSYGEYKAFVKFLKSYTVDMIQWRNLNYDPVKYFKELNIKIDGGKMLGIKNIIDELKHKFPRIMMGYFNPSRKRISRGRI